MRCVVIGGFFKKLPEALNDLVKDVLPQRLIHILRVRVLNVRQDHLLIESQKVSSAKHQGIKRNIEFTKINIVLQNRETMHISSC